MAITTPKPSIGPGIPIDVPIVTLREIVARGPISSAMVEHEYAYRYRSIPSMRRDPYVDPDHVRVILRSACGGTQEKIVQINCLRAGLLVSVSPPATPMMLAEGGAIPAEQVAFSTRRFEWRGDRDADGLPILEERVEVPASSRRVASAGNMIEPRPVRVVQIEIEEEVG